MNSVGRYELGQNLSVEHVQWLPTENLGGTAVGLGHDLAQSLFRNPTELEQIQQSVRDHHNEMPTNRLARTLKLRWILQNRRGHDAQQRHKSRFIDKARRNGHQVVVSVTNPLDTAPRKQRPTLTVLDEVLCRIKVGDARPVGITGGAQQRKRAHIAIAVVPSQIALDTRSVSRALQLLENRSDEHLAVVGSSLLDRRHMIMTVSVVRQKRALEQLGRWFEVELFELLQNARS